MTSQSPRLMTSTVPYVSPFVVDDRGDVWKRTDNGYVHRLYMFVVKEHPNHISNEMRFRIDIENAKRLAKGRSYNYFNSK